MKKTSCFIIALCTISIVMLGVCICLENSKEWIFAFLSLVFLLCFCIIEDKNTQKLKLFAYKDGLTGVQNRTAYEERVAEINKKLKKNRKCNFGVVVFDVNGLKRINDSLGHRAGDAYIFETAKLIEGVYRDTNLYRFGGDEFVVIIEGNRVTNAIKVLENSFAESVKIFNITRNDFPADLSVAVGSAVYDKNADSYFADVFNKADKSMYNNKKLQKRI